jgi:hypothetical protein
LTKFVKFKRKIWKISTYWIILNLFFTLQNMINCQISTSEQLQSTSMELRENGIPKRASEASPHHCTTKGESTTAYWVLNGTAKIGLLSEL